MIGMWIVYFEMVVSTGVVDVGLKVVGVVSVVGFWKWIWFECWGER